MSFRNRRAGRLVGRFTAVAAASTLVVLGGGASSALAGTGEDSAAVRLLTADAPVVAAGETVGGITTVDDRAIGNAGRTSVSASVLSNDTGDSLKVIGVVGETGNETGTVTFTNTSVRYVPADSQPNIAEAFIYTVQDANGDTATARVVFALRGAMPAPDLEATITMSPWDGSEISRYSTSLWDTPEWAALAAAGVIDPEDMTGFALYNVQNGTLDNSAYEWGALSGSDGNVLFQAAPGYYGTVVMQYVIYDLYSQYTDQPGTITIHIVPELKATTASTTFGNPVEIPVLQFTTGDNSRTDGITIEAANGTVEIIDNVPVYTPNPGFYGVDTFTVRTFTDETGWTAMPLDVAVTVTVLEPQAITDQTPYNTPKTVDLSSTGTTEVTSAGQGSHGTVEVVDGNVVYTPNPGYVGEDSFTVAGLDADGQLTSVTVDITVAPPAGQNVSTTTPFETPKTVDVLSTTGGTSVTSVGQGSNGSVAIVDGEVVYTPNPGFSGPDSFTATVLDEHGTPVEVTVSVTVDDPIEVATETPYETPVDVDVLGETGGTEVTGVADGDNGTVTVDEDGNVVYTPNPGFVGEDEFPVSIIDEDGNPATVIVTVTVAGPEDVEMTTTTPYETPKIVDVLGESGGSAVTGVGQGTNGSVAIDGDGNVVYTPNPGFQGQDEFVATVVDEHGNPFDVIVTVNVGEVVETATETDYNTPVEVDVIAETDGGEITAVTDGDNGTVAIDPDGNVVYTPNPGFVGEDEFTAIVTDDEGNSTAVVVTVTVAGPEDDAASAVTPHETPVTVDVLGVTDGESVSAVGQGTNGTVVVDPDGNVVYTPNPGFTGEDVFVVTVLDEYGTPFDVTVTVTVGDAIELEETTPYNTPKEVDVIGETDGGEIASVTDGENGTVGVDDEGNVVYTPNPGFVGEDEFTVIVTDEDGNPTSVIVTVTVEGPAPAEVVDETDYNTPKEVDVLGETGGEITGTTDGEHGTVEVDDEGKLIYTPDEGFVGEDTFTVIVTDEHGNEQEVTVTVTVAGPEPIEVDDRTGYETPKEIDVVGETGGTISGTGQGEHGSVEIGEDGKVVYTPDEGFVGEDTFTVIIIDEFGNEQEVVVTVTVDPPATGELATETPFETSKTIDILGETGAESISSVTQGENGTVVINEDGTVTYIPNEGFSGVDTFTVTVINPDGTRSVITVTVTVGEPAVADQSDETVRTGVLATTGVSVAPMAWMALGAAVLGGLLLFLRRQGHGQA